MTSASLLVSPDAQAVRVVTRVLDDMGTVVDVCAATEGALKKLASRSYETLIVDCALHGADQVLRKPRGGPGGKAVSVAVIDAWFSIRHAFQMGADLAVHKPLSPDQARISLRAARGLAGRERRRAARHSLQVVATLNLLGVPAIRSVVLDAGPTGISVQAAQPLQRRQSVGVRVSLPGTRRPVEAIGEVAWCDDRNRAGIRFTEISPLNQRLWSDWQTNFSLGRSLTTGPGPVPGVPAVPQGGTGGLFRGAVRSVVRLGRTPLW